MKNRLYHNQIYDTSAHEESYWAAGLPNEQGSDSFAGPLLGEASADVAIIGGGFTGLSAALHLARDHDVSPYLLEAGPISWGASGRNGGFCGLAATKLSIATMIKRYGLEETKRFFHMHLEASDLLLALARDEKIDFQICGSGNYEVAHAPPLLPKLLDYGESLQKHFGIATRPLSKEAFAEEVHDGTEQFGGLHIETGFALNPMRLSQGLAAAAARHGAKLHPYSSVIAWEREGDGRHRLITPKGSLLARKVIFATNGYMPERLHPAFHARILPVISNIAVTRPLSEEERRNQAWDNRSPICNARELLFYYRLLPDNRLLLGARGDLHGTRAGAAKMKAWMEKRIGEIFPAFASARTDFFWRGLVCMTRKLAPSLGILNEDPSVLYAYGYHASGVNTAPWAGRQLARLAVGDNNAYKAIPAVMSGQSPRIPLPGFRRLYLSCAYKAYRLADFVAERT